MQNLGIIGGGQLAWMMAEAASKLDIALAIQTPHMNDPAVKIANRVILAPIADAQATARLAKNSQVITFENEFINLESLRELELQGVCFRPPISSLTPLLDKYDQRKYLQALGINTPNFKAFTREEIVSDYPKVLKVRRHGYDGQGTFIIQNQTKLNLLLETLGHVPLLIEEYIPFEKELAVIVARSVSGEVAIYPVVETYQKNQVCNWVIAPAAISAQVSLKVVEVATHLVESLQYIGVMGIEFFLTCDQQVLVNEVAPRTHNSGHYTLDACSCSQFEMQLRAVMGLPLLSPNLASPAAVMVNLLGYESNYSDYAEKRQDLAALPNAHVHWYGKNESRPGRKLGHVTVCLATPDNSLEIIETIENIWYE